jgi:hypothetical protein
MIVRYAKIVFGKRMEKFAYGYDVRLLCVSAQTRAAGRGMIAALTQRGDSWYKQKLAACGGDVAQSCNLPMCPVCVERTLKSLIKEAVWLLLTVCDGGQVPIIVVQHDLPGKRYERDDLFDISLPSLNQSIRRQYRQAGFPLAFSGVQLSCIDDGSMETEVWQAGVCSVIVGLPKRDVLAAIKRLCPDPSPERWRELDAGEALLSTIDPGWYREITQKEANGSMDKRIDLLPRSQLRRLGYCLNHHKITDRYALTGCRLSDDGLDLKSGVQERLKKSAARPSAR